MARFQYPDGLQDHKEAVILLVFTVCTMSVMIVGTSPAAIPLAFIAGVAGGWLLCLWTIRQIAQQRRRS